MTSHEGLPSSRRETAHPVGGASAGVDVTLDALDALRSELVARVRALSPAELDRRARGEGWTPVQLLQHLRLVESVMLEGRRRAEAGGGAAGIPTRRPSLRHRVGRIAVALIFRLGIRVRMPTPRVNPEPPMPLAQVLSGWPELSAELRRRLHDAGIDAPAAPFMRHPVSGPLSPSETATFLLDHMRHHRRQLDRILR